MFLFAFSFLLFPLLINNPIRLRLGLKLYSLICKEPMNTYEHFMQEALKEAKGEKLEERVRQALKILGKK